MTDTAKTDSPLEQWPEYLYVAAVGKSDEDIAQLQLAANEIAGLTARAEKAEAACEAMVSSFRKVIPIAECGVTPLPAGHSCGPEGNCDSDCMTRAYEERDLVEARQFLYQPNPGQPILDELSRLRAEVEQLRKRPSRAETLYSAAESLLFIASKAQQVRLTNGGHMWFAGVDFARRELRRMADADRESQEAQTHAAQVKDDRNGNPAQ